MKQQSIDLKRACPPERDELKDLPKAPRLIMEISRLLRARMQASEGTGVMAQNTARLILGHLAVQECANQLELVRLTRLKAPTVSILVRQMEAEGYVTRTPDEHDRRAVLVRLTDKGRAWDRAHLGRICTNDHVAMRDISPERERELTALLLQIRENLLGGELP